MSEFFRKGKGRWGPRISVIGVAILVAFGLSGQLAWAATPIHAEVGDAGPVPPGQPVLGPGVLTQITGTLGAGDQEDLYQICLTGTNTFSATTTGSALADPQLFLFNAAGTGVAANDDTAVGNAQSTLPVGATVPVDPKPFVPINYPPGIYYLGISSFDHDPTGTGPIFPNNSTGIVGPIPGAGPLTGWAGASSGSGAYTIALTGAAAVNSVPCGNVICAGPPPPGAIVGTNGNDVLNGTPGDDVIFGLDGVDVIFGLGGNDIICGGLGNDVISGGAGDDFIAGGDGVDTLSGDTGNDTINGGTGVDNLFGGDGDDTIDGVAGSVNNTNGGNGSDTCVNPNTAGGALNCEL